MNEPKKYIKKQVTIEARQWDGTAEEATPIIDWILSSEQGAAHYDCAAPVCTGTASGHRIAIRTLEGKMLASAGDWIIKGVQGEFYPIKESIFRETYEAGVDWQAKRDTELGRERFPESHNCVAYPTGPDHVRVWDEQAGTSTLYRRGETIGPCRTDRAATAYFAAHPLPEPRPWEGAKRGDVWVLTLANGRESAFMRMANAFESEDEYFAPDSPVFTAGFPLWVDGKPVNGQEEKA